MNKPATPCKDCTKRQVGCHAQCEDYKAYQDALEDYKRTVREIRATDDAMDAYEQRKAKRLFKS